MTTLYDVFASNINFIYRLAVILLLKTFLNRSVTLIFHKEKQFITHNINRSREFINSKITNLSKGNQ